MHAPLQQTAVRRRAIEVCRKHRLAPQWEEWLWSGFDKGGYQVRHLAPPPPAGARASGVRSVRGVGVGVMGAGGRSRGTTRGTTRWGRRC
eukprot:SAG11_NODE_1918_length_4070_cov_2.703097_4_plen_90_part_00